MTKYIKNSDISVHTWVGVEVSAGSYYLIPDLEILDWANNNQLLIDIVAGNAIVAKSDDGLNDIIDINDAINLLKGNEAKDVKIVEQIDASPFASKTLANGKKLYAREHGIPSTNIAAGATVALVYEIPYAAAKITGAEIIGCQKGDTCNFKILDTDTGLLTTIPLHAVNQFGFDVNMSSNTYIKEYSYDADLFLGLHVSIEYTNNGDAAIDVAVNLNLHEVKD